MLSSCFQFTSSFCDYDDDYDYDDDDEQIDFCGCNSNKIVEITLRRDFLLLKLQELVDAKTPQQAEKAIKAMERETKNDEQLLKFLVRAGTFEIIQDKNNNNNNNNNAAAAAAAVVVVAGSKDRSEVTTSYRSSDKDGSEGKSVTTATTTTTLSPSVVDPFLQKLSYYHEQRRLKNLKKKRGSWGIITTSISPSKSR